MFDADDTIAAVASAPGGAVRGIVRVSGPRALNCVEALLACDEQLASLRSVSQPRSLSVQLSLPQFTASLPCDVYCWPGTRSYTRAPTVELHTIGSLPLLEAIAETVCRHGARPARPGEFTLRAFLAGRIDLTQAEAVLGVIDAADRDQLQTALKQMAGGLALPLGALRSDLLDLTAELEAGLDFVEEDIQFLARDELLRRLTAASAVVEAIQAQLGRRSEAVQVPRVAIVGAPNAGKSSLFNSLVGRYAALVSPQAGTTRDYLTARLSLGGLPIELVDTAGLAEAAIDEIDAAAQLAAADQARFAAVTLLCLDATRPLAARPNEAADGRQIIVWTKADLPPDAATARLKAPTDLHVSATTGLGIEQLTSAVAERLQDSASGEVVATTAARCRDSLTRAAFALSAAVAQARDRHGEELIAAEIRLALDELGHILGAVYTDDILDRIFSRFCIGK